MLRAHQSPHVAERQVLLGSERRPTATARRRSCGSGRWSARPFAGVSSAATAHGIRAQLPSFPPRLHGHATDDPSPLTKPTRSLARPARPETELAWYWRLCADCGQASGRALTWGDLDGEVLHVRRAWKDTGSNRRLGEPKTKRSARAVGVPAAVVAMLHHHRRSQRQEAIRAGWRNPDDLMFISEAGTALDAANVRRFVRKVAKAAGVEWWQKLTPYTLRHSAASLLVDQGVQIERVADLLGHASTQVTERYYQHRVPPECGRRRRADRRAS